MNQPASLAPPPQRLPLTITDVELLQRSGAFDAYAKVELIDGELLYVNAQYMRHMMVKSEFAYRLRRIAEAAGVDLFVGTEGSVALSANNLPEPDVLLFSASKSEGAVPGETVALIIEVADGTLAFDLGRKLQIYADAGIPEYWVVDVNAEVLHQLWSPAGGDYTERRQIAFGEDIEAVTIPGLKIATAGL